MTKREAMRQTMLFQALRGLGFSDEEARQLRRISLTLSHWAERCCNEDIETRDDGSAWVTTHGYSWIEGTCHPHPSHTYRIPNREAGALRRLKRIMTEVNGRVKARAVGGLLYYHQTDPRGSALYIVRKSRLDEYDQGKATPTPLECCYSSVGLAVY